MAILQDLELKLNSSKQRFSNIVSFLKATGSAFSSSENRSYIGKGFANTYGAYDIKKNVKDFISGKRQLTREVDELSDKTVSKLSNKPILNAGPVRIASPRQLANLGLGQVRTGAMALSGIKDTIIGGEKAGRSITKGDLKGFAEGELQVGIGLLQTLAAKFRTTGFGQVTTFGENAFFETAKRIREGKAKEFDFSGSAKDLFLSDAIGIREKHPYLSMALDFGTNLILGKQEDKLVKILQDGSFVRAFEKAFDAPNAKAFKKAFSESLANEEGGINLGAKVGGASEDDYKLYRDAILNKDSDTVNKLAEANKGDPRFLMHTALSGFASDSKGGYGLTPEGTPNTKDAMLIDPKTGKPVYNRVKGLEADTKVLEQTPEGSPMKEAFKKNVEGTYSDLVKLKDQATQPLTDQRGEANLNAEIVNPFKKEPVGEQRGFLETVEESKKTTEPLVKATKDIEPQTYKPTTNPESLRAAKARVVESPTDARAYVLSKSPPTAEKAATAIELAKVYEGQKDYDRAIEVIESYDRQAREAGQFIQAASLWNKLSPETVLMAANKAATKVGKTLDPSVKDVILKRMGEIQKLPDGPAKDAETLNLLNYVAENLPPTKTEIFDAYRYQNMLSGPRTHLRNIEGNMFNTLITRPVDIATQATYDMLKHPFNPLARDIHFSDVPKYYEGVFTSIPNAVTAFKVAFKQGPDSNKFDLTTQSGDSVIEGLRKANMPVPVSIVTRLMEASDKFNMALISAGERTRLLAKGGSVEEADAAAHAIAQHYLLRDKLGETTSADPLVARAIDELGNFALKGRKLRVVGKAFSWFVPFVTTPVNWGKLNIEHSPLGFIGGDRNGEQVARAASGTIATAIGGLMALQGNTTWEAPISEADKKYFYDSGRKPYSVRIGDSWVPMAYFGPYALALAIPAALKHNQDQTKTALTDNQLTKITKAVMQTSKFLASQTSLSNVGAFFKILDGDVSYSAGGIGAAIAGQAIPLEGLLRYVATIVDPVYRKGSDFTSNIKKQIPFASSGLEPYTKVSGEESKRDPANYLLPYDIGKVDPDIEKQYQFRTIESQLTSKKKKEEDSVKKGPSLNKPKSSKGTLKKKKSVI